MESMLGFSEAISSDFIVEDKSFRSYKLVPWISWQDWRFVKDSLFSSSPDSVSSALRRISAWRGRGCVPVVVEVTASIIEIQQKDPFFRDDISHNSLHSEEMMAMLYCMAIMRFVNGVVEKTRKKTEASIGEAADVLGIPRMLIDVRHEGSHRDLPSLRLVRLASIKALDWLKSYYWEPQTMAIPSDQTAKVRKEIKSVLRGLLLCVKVKQTTQSSSSTVKEKRVKYSEHLCGRNKILSLMARKISSKPAGSKIQINKILRNFVRLYSSFSSEVVSVLLGLLLKALDSADLVELVKSSHVNHFTSSLQTALDDWKPIIIKLSYKEPEFLLTLLKEILDMIETQVSENYYFGAEHLESECIGEFCQIEKLSCLFEWLVRTCKGLKPVLEKGSAAETGSSTEVNLPNATLVKYLHKCLLLSSTRNNQLMNSALVLARTIGNNTLVEKLKKLAALHLSNPHEEETLPIISSGSFLSQQEDSLRQAADKLEVFKLQHMKSIDAKTTGDDTEPKSRWVVAKSWNPCSIGMLPRALGSSGQLPVLDCDDYREEVLRSSESTELSESNKRDGKIEADCGLENLDNSSFKRMKESEAGLESYDEGEQSLEGVKGHLMVGGVWKQIREEEMLAIASAIRILV